MPGGGDRLTAPYIEKKGFTLAEVLITLGIIGVVAAITMPSLIADYKKKETVARAKKMYSTLAQARQLYVADNGDDNWTWEKVNDSYIEDAEKAYHFFVEPYIKVTKYCGSNKENCFPKDYYYLNKQKFDVRDIYVYFVIADGTMVRMSSQTQDFGSCLAFTFDVNGIKPPNTIGKDIFEIKVTPKILTTAFSGLKRNELLSNRIYSCNRESQYGGYACITLLLYDGWEIKDDYPW